MQARVKAARATAIALIVALPLIVQAGFGPSQGLSGGSPGGSAGGDLAGTYPNPTVAKIRGVTVSTTSPTNGQVLTYNSGTVQAEWAAGGGGASSLQAAYDGGRTIMTASAGTPVAITGAGSGSALTVASGVISSPGAGSGSERFGAASDASGARATSVGPSAYADGTEAASLGYNAQSSGSESAAVGGFANAISANSTAVGHSSTADASGALALGHGASASAANAVAIGSGASNSVANTAVFATGLTVKADALTLRASGSDVIGMTPGDAASGAASQALKLAPAGTDKFPGLFLAPNGTPAQNNGLGVGNVQSEFSLWGQPFGSATIRALMLQVGTTGATLSTVTTDGGVSPELPVTITGYDVTRGTALRTLVEIDPALNEITLGESATHLGFFGATPAAKPTVTGSRGGNAALASLLTAGANLGLWTDSTSP